MKYSFLMNADDYYIGYKFKLKKAKIREWNFLTALILSVIALFCFIMAQKIYIGIIFFIFLMAMSFFAEAMKKTALKRQFMMSPVLTGTHTASIYDEGLEIINGYEKIFTPWKSIYAVKEDSQRLIILPTYRKGIIVINKNTENKNELDAFAENLKKYVTVTEGR